MTVVADRHNTRYNNQWFHRAIDEVAVYDYALTADCYDHRPGSQCV